MTSGSQADQAPIPFRIYISDDSPNSTQALENFRILANHYLPPCSLEVIDVMADPQRALDDGVLVSPTLIRMGDPPLRIIGNLSDTAAVLGSLGETGLNVAPVDARVQRLVDHLLATEAELEGIIAGQGDAILGVHGDPILLRNAQQAMQHSMATLRQLAQRDPLTGLANRRLFNTHLRHAVERSRRAKTRLALLYLDVDHFKEINDTLGHEAGDELLRTFGARLGSSVRAADTFARLGGDEFAVLLEDVEDSGIAERVARKIQAALQDPFDFDGANATVTASIGISLFPDDAADAEALTSVADAAMYRAKRLCRGSFAFAQR